jgi:hypothetical protein
MIIIRADLPDRRVVIMVMVMVMTVPMATIIDVYYYL